MTLEGCAREVLRTYLVILLGSLFELEGVNGASRPERGPKLPLNGGGQLYKIDKTCGLILGSNLEPIIVFFDLVPSPFQG